MKNSALICKNLTVEVEEHKINIKATNGINFYPFLMIFNNLFWAKKNESEKKNINVQNIQPDWVEIDAMIVDIQLLCSEFL